MAVQAWPVVKNMVRCELNFPPLPPSFPDQMAPAVIRDADNGDRARLTRR
jgi:hypothetical protein